MLDTNDPETKRYVTRIAAQELDEYKLEMKEYKELTKNTTASPTPADVIAAAAATVSAMISPSVSSNHTFRPMDVSSSNLPRMMPHFHQPMQYMPAESAELVLSLEQDFAVSASSTDEDEIDYSICSVSNNGHYIPSPGPAMSSSKRNMIHPDETICDPLFELEDGYNFQQPTSKSKRCVSPVLSDVNVDIVGDGYCFRL